MPLGVGIWKSIVAGLDKFRNYCSFVVGEGVRARFWLDSWCSEVSLKWQRLGRYPSPAVASAAYLEPIGIALHV